MTRVTIDAAGKSLGRVASEAAKTLLGKNTTTFKKNAVSPVTVEIVHTSKIVIREKAKDAKVYHSHTGYQGGDVKRSLKNILEKKGVGDILERAIYGMLPANSLRERRMKRIKISN